MPGGVVLALHYGVYRRWNPRQHPCIEQGFAPFDAVVGAISDDLGDLDVSRHDEIHPFAVGHLSAGDKHLMNVHFRIDRQMHLAPRRYAFLPYLTSYH